MIGYARTSVLDEILRAIRIAVRKYPYMSMGVGPQAKHESDVTGGHFRGHFKVERDVKLSVVVPPQSSAVAGPAPISALWQL